MSLKTIFNNKLKSALDKAQEEKRIKDNKINAHWDKINALIGNDLPDGWRINILKPPTKEDIQRAIDKNDKLPVTYTCKVVNFVYTGGKQSVRLLVDVDNVKFRCADTSLDATVEIKDDNEVYASIVDTLANILLSYYQI